MLAGKLSNGENAYRIIDTILAEYDGTEDVAIAKEVIKAKAAKARLSGDPAEAARLLESAADRRLASVVKAFPSLKTPESVFLIMLSEYRKADGDAEKLRILTEFLDSNNSDITPLERANACLMKARLMTDRDETLAAAKQAIAYADDANSRFGVWDIRREAYELILQQLNGNEERTALLAEITTKYGAPPDDKFKRFVLRLESQLSENASQKPPSSE